MNKNISNFLSAPADALLPTKIVAAYLNKSISWFNCKAVSGGGIPYIKLGNKRLYKKQDVLDWLDSQTSKVTSTSEYSKKEINYGR